MSEVQDLVASTLTEQRPPRWKSVSGAVAAVLLSVLLLASGIWKLLDLDATAERMIQSLVPVSLSMAAAIAVPVAETFAGVLLLMPRYRRWGAWLAGLMLIAFMLYIGVLYNRLLGEDCNCFPWIRRVVGPAFFVGDAAMLALALLAAWGSRRPQAWRPAAAILCGLLVIAAGSYGVTAMRRSRADVPETAMVDGKRVNLRQGRLLLYFFDPECTHCLGVAREMAKRCWGATRIVVIPTREPQFAPLFLKDAGLSAGISPDAAPLRKAVPFTDPPYAIAVDRGKVVAKFNSGQMESENYYATLQRLGHMN
ncbi:MAG: MauE/DoxX family redox-associated membrane protein [Bryobacteraceae bacterium]